MATQAAESRNRGSDVKVLDKAFALLEAIGASDHGRSLTELAAELDLPVPTVFRLLQNLVRLGYAEQDGSTRLYYLGLRVLGLRAHAIRSVQLAVIARPLLRELMLSAGCVAHLAVYRDGDVVYVDRVDTPATLRHLIPVGMRVPAHVTALGKVLLAALPDPQLDQYLGRDKLEQRTPNTVTDPARLREHLLSVRERGYALDAQEAALGVWCAAAPVHDYTSKTIAAISVSMNEDPYPQRIEGLIEVVVDHARRISAAAGYQPVIGNALLELEPGR